MRFSHLIHVSKFTAEAKEVSLVAEARRYAERVFSTTRSITLLTPSLIDTVVRGSGSTNARQFLTIASDTIFDRPELVGENDAALQIATTLKNVPETEILLDDPTLLESDLSPEQEESEPTHRPDGTHKFRKSELAEQAEEQRVRRFIEKRLVIQPVTLET